MTKIKTNIKDWNIDASWTLFLDRDGVINQKIDSYVKTWQEFSFLPKVPEAISILNCIFHKIIIVTNQQGIDKGIMTHEDLSHIHTQMLDVLEYYDAQIDEIYYEPSLAVFNSFRRKPNPGMLIQAQKEFPTIDFSKSILIGDSLSDILAGNKVGMKTVWIENKLNVKIIEEIRSKVDFSVGGLYDFCGLLKEQNN